MSDTMFGGHTRTRWTGSRALVPLDPSTCPHCFRPYETETITEAPLLRHGGYGAARASIRRHCSCGWSMLAEVSEVRP